LKARVHTCLANTIPPMLEKLGVASAAQSVVLDHVLTEARRLHLAAFGGFPGSALPTEWHILRNQRGTGSISSWAVKGLMLGLAAILPASWFYRLRARWGGLRTSSDPCAV
jgi:hypothetical protein